MTILTFKPQYILRQYHLHPSKRLGQNFLIDRKVLYKIIGASDLSENDIVVEVGPGLGILTIELARRVKKVVAVEKDKKMIAVLKEILEENKIRNVEIVQGDILKLIPNNQTRKQKKYPTTNSQKLDIETWDFFRNSELRIGHYKVIANIPYYLTSPLIRKFLELKNPPQAMTLMIQKEVAQRICACPPRMTLLSVAVQFYAEPKIISYVSKKSFWPQPKVDSAIIKILPHACPQNDKMTKFRDDFFKVVRAGFSHPRKQLANNLSTELKIDRQKIENFLERIQLKPTRRAEELTVDNWRILTVLIVENVV